MTRNGYPISLFFKSLSRTKVSKRTSFRYGPERFHHISLDQPWEAARLGVLHTGLQNTLQPSLSMITTLTHKIYNDRFIKLLRHTCLVLCSLNVNTPYKPLYGREQQIEDTVLKPLIVPETLASPNVFFSHGRFARLSLGLWAPPESR